LYFFCVGALAKIFYFIALNGVVHDLLETSENRGAPNPVSDHYYYLQKSIQPCAGARNLHTSQQFRRPARPNKCPLAQIFK